MSLKKYIPILLVSALLVSCGKNNGEEPVAPVQSAAPASDFTSYDGNGNATNFQVCPDNPQQYCAQSCQQASFGSCTAQSQPQVNVVRITRITVVLPIVQVITVPQNEPPGRQCNNDQIVYNRAGSCQDGIGGTVVLGSLMVSTPAVGQLHLRWNNNQTAGVDHYRVIAHGKTDLSSSWVSQKIGCQNSCEVLLTRNTIGDATSFAGTKIPGPLDTFGAALGDLVPLLEQKVYWYEVVAYNQEGSVFRGSENQPITRTFDFRQAACGGVIVAGFCSLQ